MNRDETKAILRIIMDTYPHFKPSNLPETVSTWNAVFERDDFNAIKVGLYAFIRSDISGFAPTPGQILERIQVVSDNGLNDGEAWSLVARAMSRSGYNAKEEYEKLPPELQKAVGSPQQLHEWAIRDDSNMDVIQSIVLRNYRQAKQRQKDMSMMGDKITALVSRALSGGGKNELPMQGL